ncbi:hypothetical protein MSAN_00347600 [Mycena sanguinolenta]|uniref:Uncharacterized protein n=1 Tax=Mycena sanguinolenta TaxID=230812 RepID=A0A8H6Z8S0_9AGAR|nr:hypothetical protein MSAN_00347600 [Mycena sanguinolenta]
MIPTALPLELQMEIFVLAARSRPVAIPKLMLVSWWVNKLVEPFLYRTIVFSDPIKHYPAFRPDVLLRAIQSKPASFFRDSVRHLNFSAPGDRFSEEDARTIISACSGVVNLHVPSQNLLTKVFLDLLPPVKRIYTNVEMLFHPSPVDFSHPSLSHLTHLQVFDWVREETANQWASLATLPHLTHLSFANCRRIFPVFRRILDTSNSLQILVLLTSGPLRRHDSDSQENELLTQDPRFVAMISLYYQWDWQMGVHTGQDYWARAENFVAKRKAGLVQDCFMTTIKIFSRNSTNGLLDFHDPGSHA